jgi:hypothetical protein
VGRLTRLDVLVTAAAVADGAHRQRSLESLEETIEARGSPGATDPQIRDRGVPNHQLSAVVTIELGHDV